MTWLGLRFALREPTQFALTAGGLACAVVLTVFLAGVYRSTLYSSLSYVSGAEADVWVGRQGSWNLMRSSGVLHGSVGRRILEMDGVEDVEPVLVAFLAGEVGELRRTLMVLGVEADAEAARPRHVRAGNAIPGHGEIVVDRAFASRAGVGLGDTVTLAEHALTVSGITDDTNLLVTQYCFVARSDLVAAVGLGDIASFFLVRAAPGWRRDLASRVEHHIEGVAAFDRETFIANNREEVESGFLPVLWAIALLGLVVGGSIVAIMTYAAVLERREDYVVLAAIGAGPAVRFSIVMQQAMVAALVGAVVGLAVLFLLQSVLPTVVPELQLRLEPWIAGVAIVGAMAMAAAGAAIPGRVATRFAPLEALRK